MPLVRGSLTLCSFNALDVKWIQLRVQRILYYDGSNAEQHRQYGAWTDDREYLVLPLGDPDIHCASMGESEEERFLGYG